jgi:hypothetical protein
MRRSVNLVGAGVLVAGLAASGAQAAFFSFASDSADQAWTFQSTSPTTFVNGTGVNNPIILNIDDNNGILPTLQFSTHFTSSTTIAFAGDVVVGGAVSHNYTAVGNFSFVDNSTNIAILTGTYSAQLFTARGAASSWFTTATMQGDNSSGSVNLNWGGATLAGYGLTANTNYAGAFAFALDSINTSGAIPYSGQNPGVGLTNSLPNANWFSEASFVASTVPAPASLSLLGLGGLIAARRRRS